MASHPCVLYTLYQFCGRNPEKNNRRHRDAGERIEILMAWDSIFGIYLSRRLHMSRIGIAKIFRNGRSQAVRLPKEFDLTATGTRAEGGARRPARAIDRKPAPVVV